MEWNVISQLLDPKLAIVLAVCWVLGFILKQTPKVPNWSIVYIVTVFAIVFAVWIMGISALSFLQGFLCGAVSVYGYQMVKQAKEGAEKNAN
ncbi:hypothetical protein Back11_12190 [Paenibacillus baekrokdamisoli]|uniref:Uncharacterized protein n=1 Tax=Paenibacillus baekrokdamisoli TaxID=1712516 RepID=A0A3G9J9A6_9BACL|nr:phage holin family protein [Paenibacillus baekrokdamisoli]MBB3070524.1 glucan phosphoethanolaminetransferase (alkaline phosphatase superfamily) [Paenibacillus baekrokdamisoli]BBH19874.1 hypothetical protein Back11_12190 [Paenibacillus baekrokdamisoli]